MRGLRSFRSSPRCRLIRAGAAALLALLGLLSIANATTQAHCIDPGGLCAPATAAPAGTCHENEPPGAVPGCGSCVDILVPEDASARCNRPGREFRAPAATPSPLAGVDAVFARDRSLFSTVTPHSAKISPHPSLRSTVLLI